MALLPEFIEFLLESRAVTSKPNTFLKLLWDFEKTPIPESSFLDSSGV